MKWPQLSTQGRVRGQNYMDANIIFFIAVSVPDVECPRIKVSGSDFLGCDGTYFITSINASRSSKPVYKKQGYDRYIFHYPNSSGWKIGAREYLSPGDNEGNYFFKGKSFSKESDGIIYFT